MLKRLADWWMRTFGPTPPPTRRRVPYQVRACAKCGKQVAHTKAQQAWPHKCEPKGVALATHLTDDAA